jgi:hypothetical protein
MMFGFKAVLFVGALCYLVALAAIATIDTDQRHRHREARG